MSPLSTAIPYRDPAVHSNADPDPVSHKNADPLGDKSNLDPLDKDQFGMRRGGKGGRPCDVIRRRQTNQYGKSSIWFIDFTL
jgi:hypothetical protein